MIEERSHHVSARNDQDFVRITLDDQANYQTQAISTIISEGDAVGAVILCSQDDKETSGRTQEKLVQTAAGFLGKQMEQ